MSEKIRWGIVGTGGIAKRFAADLAGSRTGRLAGAAGRSEAKARVFAAAFPGVRAHRSYDELLSDRGIDAVYIATPHTEHLPCALQAAAAGKHILCEKPLALNLRDASSMVTAALGHGVLLMEALMYRCHPLTSRLAQRVRSGEIGELVVIKSSFCDAFPFDPAHRAYNRSLGGGAILDLGVYPASLARLLADAAGQALGVDPARVRGTGRLNATTGVDEYSAATALFPSGAVAELACGFSVTTDVTARIHGTLGWIEVPQPFLPGRVGGAARLIVHHHDSSEPEVEIVCASAGLYALEADAFGDALRAGRSEVPAVPHADTLGTLAMLDAWRAEVGVTYDADAPIA